MSKNSSELTFQRSLAARPLGDLFSCIGHRACSQGLKGFPPRREGFAGSISPLLQHLDRRNNRSDGAHHFAGLLLGRMVNLPMLQLRTHGQQQHLEAIRGGQVGPGRWCRCRIGGRGLAQPLKSFDATNDHSSS